MRLPLPRMTYSVPRMISIRSWRILARSRVTASRLPPANRLNEPSPTILSVPPPRQIRRRTILLLSMFRRRRPQRLRIRIRPSRPIISPAPRMCEDTIHPLILHVTSLSDAIQAPVSDLQPEVTSIGEPAASGATSVDVDRRAGRSGGPASTSTGEPAAQPIRPGRHVDRRRRPLRWTRSRRPASRPLR